MFPITDLTDSRLVPARPDLADLRLRGRIDAERYVAGQPGRLIVASAPLRRRPSLDAGIETEAVMGDPLTLYDTSDGFTFVQFETDGYVGYLPAESCAPGVPSPTHRVTAIRDLPLSGRQHETATTRAREPRCRARRHRAGG